MHATAPGHSGQHRRSGSALAVVTRLRLVGGFQLLVDSRRVETPLSVQRLVSYIALQEWPSTRTRLAFDLWPDTSDRRASASLRSALWRLRSLECCVVCDASRDRLELCQDVIVDVHELLDFERRSERDDCLIGEPPDALATLGELLPDWDDEWVVVARERVRQRKLFLLEQRCDALVIAGRLGAAVDSGLIAVSVEPFRESAHRALIRAQIADGNLADARRQYDRYCRIVAEELGVGPSAMLEELREQIESGGLTDSVARPTPCRSASCVGASFSARGRSSCAARSESLSPPSAARQSRS